MSQSPSRTNAHRVDSPTKTGVGSAGVVAGPMRPSQMAARQRQPVTPSVQHPVQPELQTQRIDTPHAVVPDTGTPIHGPSHGPTPSIDRDAWLRLHAAELIRRLQLWAAGLEAREANLNAAFARQDLRERQFRLQQTEFQSEMAEARLAAGELQDQINAKISAHSRRLAFQSLV